MWRGLASTATASLIALLAFSVAHGDCTQCATARVPETIDGIQPFFAVSSVTVYLDADARQEIAKTNGLLSQQSILSALQAWGTCSLFPGIPTFHLSLEAPPENRDVRTTILIDYEPTKDGGASGANPLADVDALTQGTNITLYGLCRQQTGNCNSNQQFLWTSAYGEQIIAHEFGHTLGLGHDKGSSSGEHCTEPGLMQAVTSSSESLSVLSEYCALASRLNDPNETCGLNGLQLSVHPCQECQRKVGGTVFGLDDGESVKLHLSILDNGGFGDISRYGEGGFEFVTGVPEGFQFEVTAESSNPEKPCQVEGGSGVIGGSDVLDIAVQCECLGSSSGNSVLRSAVAKFGSSCRQPNFGEVFDPDPDVRVVQEACDIYPIICSGGGSALPGPWWWVTHGPPTNDNMCGQQPFCYPVLDCTNLAATSICTEETECKDFCNVPGFSTLRGPSMALESVHEGDVVSGILLLEGVAADVDGLRGILFFLDGEPAVVQNLQTGLPRPDVCAHLSKDCNAAGGFRAELDTTGLTDGPHRIDIIAVDGRATYASAMRIHEAFEVDNACISAQPPSAVVVSPVAGSVVRDSVEIAVTASAESGVDSVRFFVDGARLSTDWVAPYEWTWDCTSVPDGPHTLHVQVVDRCGGVDVSPTVTVETANVNSAPTLELEVPTSGVSISGSAVEVSGWALDGDGIERIELRLDGSPVSSASALEVRTREEICSAYGAIDPGCPDVGWALQFDSTTYPDGPHTLSVVVTDKRGGSTSKARAISVLNQALSPPLLSWPDSVTTVIGSSAVFTVSVVSGVGPFGFQWQYREGSRWLNIYDGERDGRVSGASTPQLTVSSVDFPDAGGYRCRAWNSGGVTSSVSASLTVLESLDAPTVSAGIDQLVTEGGVAELRVTAEGVGPLSYQWEKWNGAAFQAVSNGGRINGAASSTLRIGGAELTDAGRYRCLVSNAGGTTPSAEVRLTVNPDLSGSCVEGPNTICLYQDRFEAEVVINGSPAKAKPYSDLGGLFTLNNPDNVEAAVKILDGTGINGRYWVFYGSLTSLAYTLTVTDTVTGNSRTYQKDAGSFCGSSDTQAFQDPTPATGALFGSLASILGASTTGACQSSSTQLCLLGSRFAVQVLKGGQPQTAVPASPLSGVFTFGSTANPEVIVKVLDGTPVNDWYWVFFGSLTSQDYEVVVTDTATGEMKSYPSPGESCGLADTQAF